MMKMLRKIGIEGNFLDSIKSTHKKTLQLNYTKWRKSKRLLPKVSNKANKSTLTSLIQYSAGKYTM